MGSGKSVGSVSLARGALYALLSNPIYIGQIRHKALRHPGQHQGIIDPLVWDAVQRQLQQNAVTRRAHRSASSGGFLTGKLFDDQNRRLTPTYAVKQGRRYRYYVSQKLNSGGGPKNANEAIRLPASMLEQVVSSEILKLLNDQHKLVTVLREADIDPQSLPGILRITSEIGTSNIKSGNQTKTPAELIQKIVIAKDHLSFTIDLPCQQDFGQPAKAINLEALLQIAWQIPTQFRRRGSELRLVIPVASSKAHLSGGEQSGAHSMTRSQLDSTLIKGPIYLAKLFI